MGERLSPRLRAKRIAARLAREGRGLLGPARTVYVDRRVDEYRGYWEAAARLIGADFGELAPGLWEARLDGRRTRIANYVVEADDPVTLRVAGDKALCLGLAEGAGVPVPEHRVFRLASVREARAHVERAGGLWVVKPARGSSSGLGVTTGVRTARQVEDAAVLASLFCPDILLERMVPGESCRLLYLDGELVHAVRRRGARVTGDGASTIRTLAGRAGLARVLADPASDAALTAQGLSADAVPAAGREVVVRGIPAVAGSARELRTVYDETITSLVHPALARSLADVVRRLGSRFAGVDVVTLDPGRSLEESGGALIEINTTPGIHHHYHTDDERRTHPVAVRVLRRLLDADDLPPPSHAVTPEASGYALRTSHLALRTAVQRPCPPRRKDAGHALP
ncbi:MAG TPA: hypothetical protein VF746_10530 [Longimicrobium sp.]|jgi:cyanophycin synthetase